MAQYTQKSASQGPDNYWGSLEVNDGRTVCFGSKVILNQKETDTTYKGCCTTKEFDGEIFIKKWRSLEK
jgi:hypothetical protein